MRSMEVKVLRLPFLVPRWAVAQVLFPRRVLVKRGVQLTRRLLAHELVHVQQLARMGLLRYWCTYLHFLLSCGYRDHPMELDAIVRSAEPAFLDWADALLATMPRDDTVRSGVSSGRPVDLR